MYKSEHKPFPAKIITVGFSIMILFAVIFITWSIKMPLSSAVVAPGIVNVDSSRKQIQHLEGGIVDTILVNEGELVRAGQILVELKNIAPTAEVKKIRSQYFEALAILNRLSAEQEGREVIKFSDELSSNPDSESIRSAIVGQNKLFKSRAALQKDAQSILRQKIAQFNEEILGLKGQLSATEKQIGFIDQEIVDAERLYNKQLMAKRLFLRLKRDRVELIGQQSELRSKIAQSNQKVLEQKFKITELMSTLTKEVVEELLKQRTRVYELSLKLEAAKDVLNRTQIVSPINGVVVNLQIHTKNGVIAAGQQIMEIVPSSDELVVDARIKPDDIELIKVGMDTDVQFTSLNRRDLKPVQGRLTRISADRLMDENSGKQYYGARIRLNPRSVKTQGISVIAGMGADVFIKIGERTTFEYLFDPIARTFDRGLKEQ